MSRFAVFVLLAAVLVVFQAQVKADEGNCSANEEYDLCGNACEPSCETPDLAGCVGCTHGFAACKCKDGYVRKGSECVTRDQC